MKPRPWGPASSSSSESGLAFNLGVWYAEPGTTREVEALLKRLEAVRLEVVKGAWVGGGDGGSSEEAAVLALIWSQTNSSSETSSRASGVKEAYLCIVYMMSVSDRDLSEELVVCGIGKLKEAGT
jgi:hypothetical protein